MRFSRKTVIGCLKSRTNSIDADMQLINQANGKGGNFHMEAPLEVSKAGFGREFLVFRKITEGK
jgi:hypothetical protein